MKSAFFGAVGLALAVRATPATAITLDVTIDRPVAFLETVTVDFDDSSVTFAPFLVTSDYSDYLGPRSFNGALGEEQLLIWGPLGPGTGSSPFRLLGLSTASISIVSYADVLQIDFDMGMAPTPIVATSTEVRSDTELLLDTTFFGGKGDLTSLSDGASDDLPSRYDLAAGEFMGRSSYAVGGSRGGALFTMPEAQLGPMSAPGAMLLGALAAFEDTRRGDRA